MKNATLLLLFALFAFGASQVYSNVKTESAACCDTQQADNQACRTLNSLSADASGDVSVETLSASTETTSASNSAGCAPSNCDPTNCDPTNCDPDDCDPTQCDWTKCDLSKCEKK